VAFPSRDAIRHVSTSTWMMHCAFHKDYVCVCAGVCVWVGVHNVFPMQHTHCCAFCDVCATIVGVKCMSQ